MTEFVNFISQLIIYVGGFSLAVLILGFITWLPIEILWRRIKLVYTIPWLIDAIKHYKTIKPMPLTSKGT